MRHARSRAIPERARGVALAVAAVLAAAAGAGAPARAADAGIAEEVIGYFVVPRTRALAEEAEAQRDAWTGFCARPSAAGLTVVRAAFGHVVDAWAAVSLVRFGPSEAASRHERMNHFPERRNAIGRALAPLLAPGDEATLETRVAAGSVAGQGLAALERVLHDSGAEAMAGGASAEARRRCAAGRAVAGALARTAREIADGWASGPAGLDEREILVRAATDLLTAYRVALELEVKAVIGDGPAAVKAEAGPFRRSGRTERTLAIELAAARALASILAGSDARAQAALDHAAAAQSLAERLDAPLATLAADPARRHRAQQLFAAVRDAHNRLGETVPAALGVVIGFNSLDGD